MPPQTKNSSGNSRSVSPLRGRSVAVCGATGFIGTRLVEKLVLEHGARVTAVVRNANRAARISGLDVELRKADLGNYSEIENAIGDQDIVFNLAHDFTRSEDENVKAFVNLADACAERNVRRLVHVSSIAVYDEWPNGDISESSPTVIPGSDYKNAKLAMEKELSRRAEDGSLPSVVIQPTIVYGPFGWMWTDRLVEQLTLGTVILPGNGQGSCHAVYVDDVADAMILAADGDDPVGEKYIISGPGPVTWGEFFEMYARALGVDSIQYVDTIELKERKSGSLASLRALLGNPLQIAHWQPVRRLLNNLQNIFGDDALETMRMIALKIRQARGPMVYFPHEHDIALYQSSGQCHIKKARDQLGYTPAFDFSAGSKLTAEYIRGKISGVVGNTGVN